MSPARRREMVDREHPSLSLVRQCALLGVSRSSIYYRPRVASPEALSLMGEIDRQYLETPFFGSRRMKALLERRGMPVSRKRVQRLMRAMGLRVIYRRPGASRRSPEHPVYPYLLRNARITRPNQSLPLRRQGGSQFTSLEFTQVLQDRGVMISRDGKRRYQDNIFVERLWRTMKYEEQLS